MKKVISIILASTLAVLAFSGCSTTKETGTGTEELTKVRVAYMPNMGSGSAVVTGIEKGFFKEYGLDVALTQFASGPPEIAALASGEIDIAQIGHGAHALAVDGEAQIFSIDCLSLADAVIANKDKGINSIADLKGKKVATTAGTSSEIILNLALASAGLTPNDLEIIQMEPAAIVTAMISDSIDACSTWSPSTLTIMNTLGDKALNLADNQTYVNEATFPSSFISTEKYATENRDILVAFTKGLLKSYDYRAENTEEIAKLLAKLIEADEKVIIEGKNEGVWLTSKDIGPGLEDGTIQNYYQNQQQIFLDSGRITQPRDVNEYIDFSIMKDAYAQIQ